jgi:spore maturation protein SpmB
MRILQRGLLTGLRTAWSLGKIIFPITLITTVLGYTPLIGWLSERLSPFMRYIGLPGEAAIPLLIGNMLNLYAPLGTIMSLDLTVKEVCIIAVMLSISHNLFVESAVTKGVGVKLWVTVVIRLGAAVAMAALINILWDGGSQKAGFGTLAGSPSEEPERWGTILWIGLKTAALGVAQLAAIVIPVVTVIQALKDLKLLDRFASLLHPFTRLFGMQKNASVTVAAGFLFGMTYGAGVMIQAVKEDGVRKKDVYLAIIFLSLCHAVVEDTIVFVPLGIPVWPLLLLRFILAVILTLIVSRIWSHLENRNVSSRPAPAHADSKV